MNYIKRILANIALAKSNIKRSENIKTVILVTGSEEDRRRWQERFEKTAPFIFNQDGSTRIISLQEKTGAKTQEGNFLGTLLAYSRLKQKAAELNIKYAESVSLIGMLFGRGERMSPFTQIEGDSKPAVSGVAEEALMYFAPVARYLEKRGFRGVLNKWADQTEIASIDLASSPAEKDALSTFDIIKFVSVLEVTDVLAEHKDWVVYDANSNMVSQVPRNKKDVLISRLKDLGGYHTGISLGPVAVSYQVLDIAEEVFAEDIQKQGTCLDFDPYVLMAFAMQGSRDKWDAALKSDQELQKLAGTEGMIPDLFRKINKVRDIFRERYKRELNLKVLDLGGDIFWTEIGQHDAMREKYLILNDKGPRGAIARKLEDIPDKRDRNENIIIDSKISRDTRITGSVIINSTITGKGKIDGSVVKDSTLNDIEMSEAFAVSSFRTGRTALGKGSGIYKSLGSTLDNLMLEQGMRHGTLLSSSGPVDMKVAESTDLRDKENTYNIPVFGNRLSFKEAYDEMFGVSAEKLEERRTEALDSIERIDERNKKFKQLRFGTSGLRDTVENMTDMECCINTRGFIAYLKEKGEFKAGDMVAVGGDRRQSTPRIKRAAGLTIQDAGGKVNDQGLVSSPALALYAMKRGIPGIMVTGSHVPADRNGIKFTKQSGEVLKSDEKGILASVAMERKKVYSEPPGDSMFGKKGMFKSAKSEKRKAKNGEYKGEAAAEYIDRYKTVFADTPLPDGTRIFLYQHSAVGRDTVKTIFESIGAEVIAPEELRSEVFVAVDTESVPDKIIAVFEKVMNEKKLDIGISLDGDSDRPLLVYRVYRDNKATREVKYLTGDILGLLAVLGLEEMGVKIDAVCIPVSANDAILEVLGEKGVDLTETRIGSPYAIAAMNESIKSHAGSEYPAWNVFSWESNGGFLAGSDLTINGKVLKALPTRDAVLPLISVIMMSANKGIPVSDLLGRLPARFTHADRIRDFPVETSKAIIRSISPPNEFHDIKNKLQALFTADCGFSEIVSINYLDGVRIFFSNGEISHLRPSGNAPEFRNYAIADTPERAKEIVEIGLREIIPALARGK